MTVHGGLVHDWRSAMGLQHDDWCADERESRRELERLEVGGKSGYEGEKAGAGPSGSRNTSFCGGANGSGTNSAANAGFEAS